ncbi:Gp138 family membrane-puncturing spike protein [Cupriavidus respiraculi]|uniref:Phage protein Gp138 N-terminal domain-containing protein n=1 Tax=Cupriavidus respiraculi TaxID=195930 RepID=A0ABN7YI73_9BURK|nr:Gp138 family membrane-puncturing spike protein [Cupriavidus respiraculi]CAG9173048.1 hypothetical protein LMG21510_02143 [Cupriavidus respiraculi]
MMDVTELRQLIAAELAEVHTSLPGVIVSYDGTAAVVRPALPKQLANGQILAAPQIVQVPVCWPCGDMNGQQALVTVPLKPGDAVMLSFSERALEGWLAGNDTAPDDPRQFDLSDAFATPMLRPGTAAADTDNVSVQYGALSLKLTPGGDAILLGPGTFIVDMPALFKKLLTYEQGMAGRGVSGGPAMQLVGDVAHTGGVITSTAPIEDGHRHTDSMGGNTSLPHS